MRKQLFIFFCLVLLVSACEGASTQPSGSQAPSETDVSSRPAPSATELEVTDPNQKIEVAAGEEFTITLRTNPSSGYHWELAEELDSGIVEYVWKDFIPTQPDLPNSTGKDIWRFKAVAPGETKIVLGYYLGMTEDSGQMLTIPVMVK